MKKFFGKTLLKGGLGLIALTMAASAVAQQKLEPLAVRLDWTPWGVHAGFHLAKNKGWYEQAGLDVRLEDGNGSVTTVQIVGSGDSFDVGHAGLASMMIARDKGLPVKAVAPFARKSDIGVLVPTESDIKGPADLKGKKLVYTAGSLEAPFIDSFLAEGGITRRDLELLNVEAAGKVTTYAVNRADAVVSTIPFVIAFVSDRRPSRAIPFADYGLNMPSFGIFASEEKLKAKGDQISRFASVTARAWQYIYDGHQDEAVQAIMAERPQARLDAKILRSQIDALYEYFGKPAKGDRIGIPVAADWEEAVKTMRSVDVISDKLSATDFYVTDLVHPERYDNVVAK
ncbi:MAG TPA: ABC transporter substrate-binding protein [Pusillimonas sp.]|uniref:ABC transporter substrate-binding protein n=1 Tax=Pusillimonas sp. TaxID=3040095 RepID=UPI002C1F6A92|nr:ABC transporter substrate-binding protein [Pusillimonas sp.]HUH88217.1 ABC transporter substrate-binding protein [Pusillimonas sp.]